MELKVIKTEEQYKTYVAMAKELTDRGLSPDTPEADRLELLVQLIETYERDRFINECPDPVTAIRYVMEQRGLRQKDLVPLLGGKNRVSEILARKRRLTLQMVRSLSEALDIPPQVLIKESGPQQDPQPNE
jgi:HTH-type transcriptional regulator / antitoxin HigA